MSSLLTGSGQTLEKRSVRLFVGLHYQRDPLTVTLDGVPTAAIVSDRFGLQVGAAFAPIERFALLFDFFGSGQKIMSVGGFLSRPPRGSLYAGFRVLEGPISDEVLTLAYSYLILGFVELVINRVRSRREARAAPLP